MNFFYLYVFLFTQFYSRISFAKELTKTRDEKSEDVPCFIAWEIFTTKLLCVWNYVIFTIYWIQSSFVMLIFSNFYVEDVNILLINGHIFNVTSFSQKLNIIFPKSAKPFPKNTPAQIFWYFKQFWRDSLQSSKSFIFISNTAAAIYVT